MRHSLSIKIYFLYLFFCLFFEANAQQDGGRYEAKKYTSQDTNLLLYRQLIPKTIEHGKRYPLVLFLHGAGERGNDNISQLKHGAKMFTNPVNRKRYPTFVLFPQCPQNAYWAMPKRPKNFTEEEPFPFDAPVSKPLELVEQVLKKVLHSYPIDKERVYVVGLSMGGMGVFDIVCRNPNLFAAAIPICGGVNTKRFSKFKSKTVFRIFHGDADSVIPVRFSREAYLKLKNNGINVEYIEFPGINHGSWEPAFNRDDFMAWLFQQKLEK